MGKACVFTKDSLEDFPSMNQLRAAAIQNPGIPIIIKIKNTDEKYIYSDGVYPLFDTEYKTIEETKELSGGGKT